MTEILETKDNKIKIVNISSEMQASFLDYSMSVITSRALPDVCDGLKPVQRRILYALYDLGMLSDKPYKKSARIVGEVIGKYHPHGDSSIYQAMVRMAQDFSYRYALVDGQGNFGSVDGDEPASMRYTEARMSKIAFELVRDLHPEIVKFNSNYDESETEPSILPAYFPNLLVNGATGIAVGMATNIPPHNLSEVIDAIIKVANNQNTTFEELLQIIKGPDFPTGAIIMGKKAIANAYANGNASVIIRSKVIFEENKNGKMDLIIEEIPYQVNKAKLIEKIADLVRDKIILGINDLRDESNREGIRIVIELKKDVNKDVILSKLYKLTPLQSNFAINLIALHQGIPKRMNLRQMIDYYLEHQFIVLINKTKHDLKKNLERAHLVEGLVIALDNIDKIIKIIKESKTTENAIEQLKENFNLSKIQARAILDMRLQRLTGLEQTKIKTELDELIKIITNLKIILENRDKQKSIIIKKLEEIKNNFGDKRKTQITEGIAAEIDEIDLISNDLVVIIMSNSGYIKRINAGEYRIQNRGGLGVNAMTLKDDDINLIIIAHNHDDLLFFTNYGKIYRIKVYEVPEFSRIAKGTPIINLLDIDKKEKIVKVLPFNEYNDKNYFFFVTTKGIVKKTKTEEFNLIRQTGKVAIELSENDELLEVFVTEEDSQIIIANEIGKAIRFKESDVRAMQRKARGVKGMSSNKNKVIGACSASPENYILTISTLGYGKLTKVEKFRLTERGSKGVKAMNLTEKNGKLVAIKVVKGDEQLMIATNNGNVIRLSLKQVKDSGRNAMGVRLIRLKDNQIISSVEIVENDGQYLEN